jgi:hypothetical protein
MEKMVNAFPNNIFSAISNAFTRTLCSSVVFTQIVRRYDQDKGASAAVSIDDPAPAPTGMTADTATVSEDVLRAAIQQVLVGADFSTLTTGEVRKKLEAVLSTDLSSHRGFIKEYLTKVCPRTRAYMV